MTKYTDIIFTRTSTDLDETFALRELPADDRDCLRLLLEMQRDSATALLEYAARDLDPTNDYSIHSDRPLTQFDYSGDHDDYNTATAELALRTTYALCAHEFDTARDTIISLFNDDDFMLANSTASIDTPLAAFLLDSYDLNDD